MLGAAIGAQNAEGEVGPPAAAAPSILQGSGFASVVAIAMDQRVVPGLGAA